MLKRRVANEGGRRCRQVQNDPPFKRQENESFL